MNLKHQIEKEEIKQVEKIRELSICYNIFTQSGT